MLWIDAYIKAYNHLHRRSDLKSIQSHFPFCFPFFLANMTSKARIPDFAQSGRHRHRANRGPPSILCLCPKPLSSAHCPALLFQPFHKIFIKAEEKISGSETMAWRRPCKPNMCSKSHVLFYKWCKCCFLIPSMLVLIWIWIKVGLQEDTSCWSCHLSDGWPGWEPCSPGGSRL